MSDWKYYEDPNRIVKNNLAIIMDRYGDFYFAKHTILHTGGFRSYKEIGRASQKEFKELFVLKRQEYELEQEQKQKDLVMNLMESSWTKKIGHMKLKIISAVEKLKFLKRKN